MTSLFNKLYAQLCAGTKVILLDTLINDGSIWQVVFEDDFNGNEIDLAKWAVSYSELRPDNAYRLPENVSVSPEIFNGKNTSASGVCIITLKKETVTKPVTL